MSLLSLIVCLLLPYLGWSQDPPCTDYAVNSCNKDQDGELFALNAISQLNCQEYCQISDGCLFYAYYEKPPVMNVNCHLFKESFNVYLDHCDVHSGPLNQDLPATCFYPDEGSCEVEQFEDCVLYGKILERNLAAPDMMVCEKICKLNQGQGCRYWTWNREQELCDLYDSAEKICNIKFGPKSVRPGECEPAETTTESTTTADSSTAETTPTDGSTTTTTTHSPITSGILISGGGGARTSVEVFDPIKGESCLLPSLPDNRQAHSMEGLTICGADSTAKTNCISFTSGKWVTSHALAEERGWHCSWATSTGTMLLGGHESPRTTEMISEAGYNGQPGFSLEHDIMDACSISDPTTESLIITGGGETSRRNTVSRYGVLGFIEQLPSLNQGRRFHACGLYLREDGIQVLLVTGGENYGLLSSTEILSSTSSAWVDTNPLPRKLRGIGSVTLEGLIYISGGRDDENTIRDEIYSWLGDDWVLVGKMNNARWNHAISTLQLEDEAMQFCN